MNTAHTNVTVVTNNQQKLENIKNLWLMGENSDSNVWLCKWQKHSSIGVAIKWENMEQIHRGARAPIFIEIALRQGSYNAVPPHTPRALPHKKTHGELLLKRGSYLWRKYVIQIWRIIPQ